MLTIKVFLVFLVGWKILAVDKLRSVLIRIVIRNVLNLDEACITAVRCHETRRISLDDFKNLVKVIMFVVEISIDIVQTDRKRDEVLVHITQGDIKGADKDIDRISIINFNITRKS